MITVLITFLLMEGVAWSMHKYVMHGFMWKYHEDHHKTNLKSGFFEKNDVFFIFFSILSMASFAVYIFLNYSFFMHVGIGISIYGATYFFIHDLFIHQRIKILRNTKNKYLLGIRRAHKIHHKHLGKEDGECFGMLLVPFKYFKA